MFYSFLWNINNVLMLSSASVIAVSFYHWCLNVFSLFFFFLFPTWFCILVIFIFYFSPFLLILASFFFIDSVLLSSSFEKKRSFLLLLWGHREYLFLTFSVSLWCIFFISPGFSASLFFLSTSDQVLCSFYYDDSLHGASCLLSIVWRGGAVVTGRGGMALKAPASLGFVALITLQQSVTSLRVTPQQGPWKSRGTHCTVSLELCAVSGVCTFTVLPLSPSLHLWKVLWPVQTWGEVCWLWFPYSASWFEIRTISPWGKCSKFSFSVIYSSVVIYVEFIICKKDEKIIDSLRQNGGRKHFSLWKNSDHHVFLRCLQWQSSLEFVEWMTW